jgi:hypothetical protein
VGSGVLVSGIRQKRELPTPVDHKAAWRPARLNVKESHRMKTVLRIVVNTALLLAIGAAAFAQHCTQTKLVSKTSGVAGEHRFPSTASGRSVSRD